MCVIGDVGAGKSSLLAAILGELQYLDGEFIDNFGHSKLSVEGLSKRIEERAATKWSPSPVELNESVSYVQ